MTTGIEFAPGDSVRTGGQRGEVVGYDGTPGRVRVWFPIVNQTVTFGFDDLEPAAPFQPIVFAGRPRSSTYTGRPRPPRKPR